MEPSGSPADEPFGTPSWEPADLTGVLAFLRAAERLKDTLRSGRTSSGRRESVAEHSWRLSLMACVLHHHRPDVDLARVLQMCVVHDLGEALRGDIPAPDRDAVPDKVARERADLRRLAAQLPAALREEIVSLWEDYEAGASPEARLVKGLDRLETILQHTQGRNPPGFDYRFNLSYGRDHTSHDPVLAALRQMLDTETARRAGNDSASGA